MRYWTLAIVTVVAISVGGCATTSPTAKGAGTGAAVGAGAGALIGSMSGNAAAGALIGGAVGAGTGAAVGNAVGNKRRNEGRDPKTGDPVYTAPQGQPGHYETRIVRQPNGETYEERVWVPDR